jgi:hypothetical protein
LRAGLVVVQDLLDLGERVLGEGGAVADEDGEAGVLVRSTSL